MLKLGLNESYHFQQDNNQKHKTYCEGMATVYQGSSLHHKHWISSQQNIFATFWMQVIKMKILKKKKVTRGDFSIMGKNWH
jgi:hypothetical protein